MGRTKPDLDGFGLLGGMRDPAEHARAYNAGDNAATRMPGTMTWGYPEAAGTLHDEILSNVSHGLRDLKDFGIIALRAVPVAAVVIGAHAIGAIEEHLDKREGN